MPKLITKNDMEYILGYTLTDWAYKQLTEYIINLREGKYIKFARGDQKTSIPATAMVLEGILPRNIIFEESNYKEIEIHKEELKMDLDDEELKVTKSLDKEELKEPDVRTIRERYQNIGNTL